jgi:sulfur carrier protein
MDTPLSTPPLITVQTDAGPVQVPPGTTVAALLATLPGLRAEGVATAVNGDFVARHQRASHVLHDGDALLCFAPITGG